jgi:hypothetical protein
VPQMLDTPEERRARLDRQMSGEQTYSERKATFLHYTSLTAQAIAVGASMIAGVMGLMGVSSKTVGIVALIPALMAYGVTSMRLDDRSEWHYDKAVQLRGLRGRLNYGLPIPFTWQDVAVIAADRDVLNKSKAKERIFRPDWFRIGKGFRSQSTESSEPPEPVEQIPPKE